MARGDYVKTYAGAIAQNAGFLAQAVLGSGGSGSAAVEALQATFPSLPGNIAGLIIGNAGRQNQATLRQYQSGALAELPAQFYQQRTETGSNFRYLVKVVATDPVTGREVIGTHYLDRDTPQTMAQLTADATAKGGVIFSRRRSGSPQYQTAGANPEIQVTLVQAIQNAR